jgi:alpha-glucosidase (family GH31 glycosyl hydrolase)
VFYEYAEHGSPVIRPLFLKFYEDNRVAKIDNQFLVGSGIMVCSTNKYKGKVKVYLPESRWFDFYSLEEVEENGELKLNWRKHM